MPSRAPSFEKKTLDASTNRLKTCSNGGDSGGAINGRGWTEARSDLDREAGNSRGKEGDGGRDDTGGSHSCANRAWDGRRLPAQPRSGPWSQRRREGDGGDGVGDDVGDGEGGSDG